MNRTPRLRSSYPATPGSAGAETTKKNDGKISLPPSELPHASPTSETGLPVIPTHLVDAPSQRLYTSVFYCALLAYRLYDWWTLVEEDSTSITLFVKWCSIDLVFVFGVPLLRIPWLEWSDSTSILACLAHVLINGLLMFRIHLPFEGWLLILIKSVFDREMSISENSVRPARILHNSSIIMGKQIINILPEGHVVMNPERLPFCLDSSHSVASIPLLFNQTKPNYIELLRKDFESNKNETIILSQKEIRAARKMQEENIYTLNYAVRKPGLYRLQKVIDSSKLEVQRRMSDVLVVKCPRATVKPSSVDKCLGDLSDLEIEIQGTPPLKVMYTRIANGDQSVHHFQNVQPENFVSPLIVSSSSSLAAFGNSDVSWAKSHRIVVPLNESMMNTGSWLYSIDQIHDAAGNIVNFSSVPGTGGDEFERAYPKDKNLELAITVHERPVAFLTQCDSRMPLIVAKGKAMKMPVEYQSTPRRSTEHSIDENSHTITWKFSPSQSLTQTGDHGEDALVQEFIAHNPQSNPVIQQTGLYTLTGVKSKYCEGIVKEPASCLLLNAPEPELTIHAESISDSCAGNSVGLLVDLNLIGTPPFIVNYDVITQSGTSSNFVKVSGLRHQFELKPTEAGHFRYEFSSIDDQVYKGHSLREKGLILEQDVKPPAFAELSLPESTIDACLEEPVEVNVKLTGENPFTLEYELIHEGRRRKSKITEIESSIKTIKTETLSRGGEYTLAITSVQDNTGCKIYLSSEAKFTVRRQRPKAAFGKLEGSSRIVAVEGRDVELPLRLTGRAPWTVKYRIVGDPTGKIMEKIAKSTNDIIHVNQMGKYEIIEVSDDRCPGSVEKSESYFDVDWFPRPRVSLGDTASITYEDDKYIKRRVCEGDIDTLQVNLHGSPPYNVKYQIHHKDSKKTGSIINKEFEAALGSATVPLDTSKAGTYEYKFQELSDALYDYDGHKFSPLVFEQKVDRKPSAYFGKPGQVYKYCEEDLDGDEAIPIRLEGAPPFSLEIDIKHQISSRPETVNVANIETTNYEFRIPHKVLSLGAHHVSIRKVRDSHGCQQKTKFGAPHVQVQVYHAPTIRPLDTKIDYCVGDRISYSLSGMPPFEIFYDFEGVEKRAKSTSTTFKRFAEKPGTFTITAVTDKASECRAQSQIKKFIHPMPTVKISQGRQVQVDIHEGAEAQILFEFWGTPPFEFTYIRSTNVKKGQKSRILETRHETSNEYSKLIRSSQEGTYEVVAIKDKFCSFSIQKDKR
ncbi:Nucleoporin POM152 [Golovinomyces cichoracearum]|uniref:Nucleoporin POM152 n=1 Tax=Golovinomyces cichoracearum TaxID=62708 RepID=A0A420H7H4_9PEZI|nr:Nucleoporin POM152 [Golovinomyces cichoracearum]